MTLKKKYRLRLTPQRLAILEYLDGNKAHPSAADIYKAVSERYPMMSFATVYNTLDTLKEREQLLELSLDTGKRRFDPNPEPHHHLICTRCRSIVDVHRSFPLDLRDAERCGYDITGNHIDFYGICPKCKRKTKSKK
ncbi:MAG TPA: transcriptional repressor [Syntrophales bacterium]|nr:transcriptional repressor [Syntrophales bacterium]